MDNIFGNLNYNGGDHGGGLDAFGDNQFPGNPFDGRGADPELVQHQPQVVQDQLPLADDGIVVAGVNPEVGDEGLILPGNEGLIALLEDEVLIPLGGDHGGGLVAFGDNQFPGNPIDGGGADLELVHNQPQVVQDQLPLADDGIVVAGVNPEVGDEGLIAHANDIIRGEGLAPAADPIIGDEGLIAPADNVIGSGIHNIKTLADLKTELAKARDPTLTGFLDARIYLAFVLNEEQLNIHESDPKKFRECILCAHKVKSKYRDGIAYLEGNIAGDYRTYTFPNGEKCTSKSRYTTVTGAAETHTERRVYKFGNGPNVILHYVQVPNHQASAAVLAKSPPPPPHQATLDALTASLEDFRAETNAKLDAMSANIDRLVERFGG